jgi:hypothetical protein
MPRLLPLVALCTLVGASSVRAQEPTLAELGFPPRAGFAHTTGSFAVRFASLPDAARPAALLARLRAEPDRAPTPGLPPDPPLALEHELFFVHVPADYRRDTPYGLLVWISPTDFGGTVRPDLRALLAEKKWIWIGAHGSGNERPLLDRHALALVAATEAPKSWTIDPARIVVAGYSGGGRTASQLALLWPELFQGGLFVMGCNWYERLDVPGEPGRFWNASFPTPPEASLALARSHPLVFLTAEHDFNRAQTFATEKAARRAGFRRTKRIEIPGIDHFGRPPIEAWRAALDALDPLR